MDGDILETSCSDQERHIPVQHSVPESRDVPSHGPCSLAALVHQDTGSLECPNDEKRPS